MSVFDTDPKPWTDEEDQMLRLLVGFGSTYGKIAIALGRTRNAVAGRAARLKLDTPQETKARAWHDRTDQKRQRPNTDVGITLNGEPLVFAVTDRPCARCAVRESVHHEHGCGQFAAEVRVRLR